MARCIICGEENRDAAYVLMIRRDGSEAEMCPLCKGLIDSVDDEKKREQALSELKKHASHCGDYEVRRFLEAVISAGDDPESYNEYIEETRYSRDKVKEKPVRDVYRLVRPAAFVLLAVMVLGGIFRAVVSFASGSAATGIIELVITAITVGAAVIILAAVMDALDEVRAISKRRRR